MSCTMVSTSHSSAKAESGPVAGRSSISRAAAGCLYYSPLSAGRFRFISIQAPNDAKDPITRRLARSHAVKQTLENKRKLQRKSGENFRVTTPKRARTATRAVSLSSLSAGALDPFQTLAVDSSRLKTLLGDCKLLLIPENCLGQAYRKSFRHGEAGF